MKNDIFFTAARLELTGQCDLRCLYCHSGEKNSSCYAGEELSLERWAKIINEAKSLGVKTFILTGGEPFLYREWQKIIEICGLDSEIIISTNGEHFTKEMLNILAGFSNVVEFRTSIDGLEVNNIIRDGSNYKKTLESLRLLKKKMPKRKVMIQTTIYQNNLSEIESLYELLKKIPIDRWRLSQLWKTIRTEKNRYVLDFSNYKLMFEMYARIIQRYNSDGQPFRLGIDNVYDSFVIREEYLKMDLSSHPCLYEFDFLCINANGDLIFCPALNIPYASVKSQTISEAISKSAWLNMFKEITIGSLPCGDCRYLKICGGGCRADAYRWLNNLKTLDVNSCCIMRKIEEIIIPLLTEEEKVIYNNLINFAGVFPPADGENIEIAAGNFLKKKGGCHGF